jgi:hypothetical protein
MCAVVNDYLWIIQYEKLNKDQNHRDFTRDCVCMIIVLLCSTVEFMPAVSLLDSHPKVV